MRLGFTGTRHPVPEADRAALEELLARIEKTTPISEAHHGDCVGADAVFDGLCWAMGVERHAHPAAHRDGRNPHRAFCQSDVVHEPKPHMDRNQDIVDACSVLIVCPYAGETQRSGTWATVRRARRSGVRTIIVWPSGEVER